jgi:hypothetical protein
MAADDLLIGALAAAASVASFKALQRDGGDEVVNPLHLVGELLVDEGGVGEAEEHAVGVLLAQAMMIVLAHQRLAAGVDIHIDAELLALTDDVVDLVIAQVQLVAVLGGPAAGAVQVAGGGGVQQDGPGGVAVVLVADFLLLVPADEVGVDEEIDKGGFQLVPVNVPFTRCRMSLW